MSVQFSNYTVNGGALETLGFTVKGATDPLGLLTYGMIVWDQTAIWTKAPSEDLTSTIWTNSEASITTTWTVVS